MLCFASTISILIILFSLTIATESVEIVEDDEFLAFVKDPYNFWQCNELEEGNEVEYSINGINGITFGFKQMRENLIHKSEAYLGILYLMRQNWQCAKIVEQFKEEYERNECHKFRKYLDILYDYLFRVYVEGSGVDPMLAQQLPAVKPIFKLQRREMIYNGTLFGVIQSLSNISKFFFDPYKSEFYDYSLNSWFRSYDELKLLNEKEYELNAANLNGTFRQQFDRELKRMAKETPERDQIEDWEITSLTILSKPNGLNDWQKQKLQYLIPTHDYKFGIVRSSPFNDSIILRNDSDLLLLALFHDPPTFYEIFKMAKKLGEMDDDFHILLNSSNLKRIFKRLNQPEELFEEIEIQIKNEFCALAFFVGDLLKKAKAKKVVLKIESMKVAVDNFISKKDKFCKEKQKKKEIKKYLKSKNLYNGKTPKVDSNPINDLKQIVHEIVEEIEQMLQKSDWIYANLKYLKIDELNLLEYNLHKMGNDQKWEEIDQLLSEWEKAYNKWHDDYYFEKNEENRPNFEEMMKKLIKVLRDFITQQFAVPVIKKAFFEEKAFGIYK